MSKVVGLEGSKKEDRCPYCGGSPECYAWTCKRIRVVTQDGPECWSVEFWPEKGSETDES